MSYKLVNLNVTIVNLNITFNFDSYIVNAVRKEFGALLKNCPPP